MVAVHLVELCDHNVDIEGQVGLAPLRSDEGIRHAEKGHEDWSSSCCSKEAGVR